MLLRSVLSSFFIFLTTSRAQSLKNGTVLNSDIDAFIDDLLAEWNSPAGFSVAVVRRDASAEGGWNVETKGYGNAKADGTNVTADTLFALGSDSKLFDALAAGLLISNKSLSTPIDWTTKIGAIIPEWELMDPLASNLTSIIDLMSHRTGMPRHDLSLSANETNLELIKRLKYLRPSTEFRETFQYCNLGYIVLSYLPAALLPDKPSLAAYVQEHIFDPLGMNATTYSFDRANASGNLADGFAREGDSTMNPINTTGTHVIPFWLQTGGIDGENIGSGPGGLISNVNDIITWLKVLLSDGVNPATNETVIPMDVLDMVTSGITVWPFSTDGNEETYGELSGATYGGGQYRATYRGHDLIEHGGDVFGFNSMITRFPNEGAGVVVFSNDNLHMVDVVRYRIFDELFRLEPVDWKSRVEAFIVGTAEATSQAVSTHRPANATAPTGGFESLVGNYSNPGYTSFELCQIVPSPASASEGCTELAATLNSTWSSFVDPAVPMFALTWDLVVSQYVKLAHFDGDVFNVTGWTGKPTGNPSSPLWAFDAGLAGTIVEFGVGVDGNVGFGFQGGIWGAGINVPDPSGNTAEERAEIWFTGPAF